MDASALFKFSSGLYVVSAAPGSANGLRREERPSATSSEIVIAANCGTLA